MSDFDAEDPRCITVDTRLEIGFIEDPNQWKAAPAQFDEETLEILGHPVMERWETPYMKKLAHIATRNSGTVLEVGFGMGISAGFIQEHQPKEHIVIEANLEVFAQLKQFAEISRFPVKPIFGLWQEVIGSIPSESVDGILFDTYPLTVEEIHGNHFPFIEHAYRILKPGGIFTYYSDEIDRLSNHHRSTLFRAGFTQVSCKAVSVNPPKECLYWNSNTIVAPIVLK